MPQRVRKLRLKNRYAIILLILAGIGLFGVVLSMSYAFFTHRVESSDLVFNVGTLQVTFDNNGNVINLTKEYPKTNTQGLSTTGYNFNIRNTGTIDAKYLVRLELDPTNTLPLEYVKLSYTKTKENNNETDNPNSDPVLVSNLNATQTFIKDQVIEAGKTDGYNLKLWIDYSAPNDIQGKTFKAKIVVDAIQNVEDGYAMASTAPVIELNKFEDGQIDQIIKKGSTFTDPGVLRVRDDKDKLTQEDVTVTGSVNTSQVGAYDITYSVTDSDNNTTTVIRTVAVDDGTLTIYKSVSEVLAAYTQAQQNANEAIMCSHIYGNGDLYLDCQLKDTLDNAIAARNRSAIILTKDLTRTTTITIPAIKDIIMDLNSKTINCSATDTHTINNTGKLNVINGRIVNTPSDNSTPGAIVNTGNLTLNNDYVSGNFCVTNFEGGNTTINNSEIVSTLYHAITNWAGSTGNFTLNGGTYYGKAFGIYNDGSGTITINDGTVTGETENSILNNSAGIININGGNIQAAKREALYNQTTGTMNIKGGIITTSRENVATVINLGTMNITDEKGKTYIGNFVTTGDIWTQFVLGNSGVLNINGSIADNCTSTTTDTNSGICIYGDKRTVVNQQQTNATMNINGAYIKSNINQPVMHYSSGSLNIKNSRIDNVSGWGTVVLQLLDGDTTNQTNARINICNTAINSGSATYDFVVVGQTPGTINYTNNVIFNSTPGTQPRNYIDPLSTGSINQIATCPF